MISINQIEKVQEIRNWDTNELTGYKVNDTIFVPIDNGNTMYRNIQEWVKKGNTITPAYTDKERLAYLKNQLYRQIQNIADTKTKEAKNYIAQMNMTQDQWERYQIKYQKAKEAVDSGDYSYFDAEASLVDGITAEDLAKAVINAYETAQSAFANFVQLIEVYRRKANKEVDGLQNVDEINLAKEYLEKAKAFDENTTEDDIKVLFDEFETALNDLRNSNTD
jgi:hypothetical protein